MLKVIPLTEEKIWEADWLNVLLSARNDLHWLEYTDDVPSVENALYVFKSDRALELTEAQKRSIASAKGAGLLHIADEYLRSDLSDYARFAYVIRMFSFSKANRHGVKTIPLGYTGNLGVSSQKRASERKYSWMFAGDWKSDRGSMAKHFRHWPGGLFSLTMPYAQENRISREQYLSGMADSAFAPCPAGNIVLETCRPYEALYFGAIPLLPKRSKTDPYGHVLGNHPLPVFEDWKTALRFAKTLYATPEKLDALQTECLQWWGEAQLKWAKDVCAFIDAGQAGDFKSALQDFTQTPTTKMDRFSALLAHQNLAQFQSRIIFRMMKYKRALTGSSTKSSWSLDTH